MLQNVPMAIIKNRRKKTHLNKMEASDAFFRGGNSSCTISASFVYRQAVCKFRPLNMSDMKTVFIVLCWCFLPFFSAQSLLPSLLLKSLSFHGTTITVQAMQTSGVPVCSRPLASPPAADSTYLTAPQK